MLRVGAILLSLWTGFNLVLALGILFMLLVLGKNAPALLILYGDLGAEGMDPPRTVNDQRISCHV